MRKIIPFIVFMSTLLIFSCVSVEYTKTGKEYEPLSADKEVKLLLSSLPRSKYEEIGVVRIKGGSAEVQIKRAKQIARQKGGHGIIPAEKKSGPQEKKGFTPGAVVVGIETEEGTAETAEGGKEGGRAFLVVRLVDREEEKIEKEKELPSGAEPPDYSSLKRATFKQLVEDYNSLREEMFRGELYPRKFYKVPFKFREFAGRSDRLLLLTTRSGKLRVYMIVPGNKLAGIREKIRNKKPLDFVYSPVDVHRTKRGTWPILKFIDDVPGDSKGRQ